MVDRANHRSIKFSIILSCTIFPFSLLASLFFVYFVGFFCLFFSFLLLSLSIVVVERQRYARKGSYISSLEKQLSSIQS